MLLPFCIFYSGWDGELGYGGFDQQNLPVRVQFPANIYATTISCSAAHTCSIVKDASTQTQSVMCWGGGWHGHLGHGSFENSATPVQVELPSGKIPVLVKTGYAFTVVLCSDGSVFAWGRNELSQLGPNNADVPKTATPLQVTTPPGFKPINVVSDHDRTCLLLESLSDPSLARIWCFGSVKDKDEKGRMVFAQYTPENAWVDFPPGVKPVSFDLGQRFGCARVEPESSVMCCKWEIVSSISIQVCHWARLLVVLQVKTYSFA